MVFCSQCGKEAENSAAKYCSRCGSILATASIKEKVQSSPSIEMTTHTPPTASTTIEGNDRCGNEGKTMSNLKQFLALKGKDRRGFFASKNTNQDLGQEETSKKKPKFFSKTRKDLSKKVNINVGLMKFQAGGLVISRGSKIPVQVSKKDNAGEVLHAAVTKYSNHDQHFCGIESYVLMYPDQKVVSEIPGSSESFTIEKYKEELGKPYSKIDLFICSDIDFQASLESDPPVEKTINYLAPFVDCTSGGEEIHLIRNSNQTLTDVKASTSEKKITTISLCDDDDQKYPNTVPQTDCAGPSTTHQKVFCPVCNKKFRIEDIENHADLCLQSKSSIFDDSLNLDRDDIIVSESEQTESNCLEESASQKIDRKSISLKIRLLLQNKAFDIEFDSKMNIEVRKNHCFSDFKKHFSKSWNKGKINYIYSFEYHGDPGIDTGGITRDFYDTALQEVKDQFFNGGSDADTKGLVPCCGTVAVADGTLRSIGHLFASSICNGGPGPGYLANWVFEFLTGGLKAVTDNLPKDFPSSVSKYKDLYNQLSHVTLDEEVKSLLLKDSSLDVLSEIGFRGNPAKASMRSKDEVMQSMFIKAIVEPFLPALTELSNGLECYNFLSVMKNNKDFFKPLFCPSQIFQWDYETFHDCLAPQYSEKGSSKYAIEIDVYKYFSDFTESLFMDETFLLKPYVLMKFLTGCVSIPPFGSPNSYKVFSSMIALWVADVFRLLARAHIT